MITIVVCEDDAVYRREVGRMIREVGKEQAYNLRVKEYADANALLAAMDGAKGIDILFLDIELGNANGIETAKLLRNRYPGLILIYLTSYKDYVYDALKTEPIDFLIKPVDKEEIKECLIKAVGKICDLDFIRVKDDAGYCHVRIDEILYISSRGKYIYITAAKGKEYKVLAKLNDFEKLFEKYEIFIRIHKSHLVNFNYVLRYENKKVIMRNEQELSISRDRRNEVRERYLALKIEGD